MFRRPIPLFAVLLAFSMGSRAQPLPDRAPIRGLIVDDAGRPIPSAVLTLRRQDDTTPTQFWGAEVRTDAVGVFVIPEAETGRYFLDASAPGFAGLASLPLNWNPQSAPARLEMKRLASLQLRVLSPGDTPLSNALVWVKLKTLSGVDPPPLRTQTGAGGEIALSGLVPASYSLVVAAQSGIAVQNTISVSSTNTAPVDVRLREGATLRIRASDEKGTALGGVALALLAQNPEEAARLAGASADPDANWALLSQANASQALVTRDIEGTVEVQHLPPGRFSARLWLPRYGTLSREVTLENGKTVEWSAQFPTARSATLSVRVVDGNKQPVANTLVALRLLPLAPNGTIDEGQTEVPDPNAPPDLSFASPGSASGARAARTDGSGRISLFPLQAGKYRVFASRPTPDSWLRAPVAPEGMPADVVVSLKGPNNGEVQVP